MKKALLLVVLGVIGVSNVIMADVNNPLITGVPSLTIAPDSRASGMGDVGAATAPDVNSQYWNAAKYAFMDSPVGLSMSYVPWLRRLVPDIYLSNLCGYFKLGERQAVSGSLRYFSYGSLTPTDINGNVYPEIQPNEFAVDLAYSLQLSQKLSMAATLRYISSNLGKDISSQSQMFVANTVAADVAAYYKTPITFESGDGKWAMGLQVANVGGKVSYNGSTYNFIPTNLRIGTSLDYPIDSYNKISVSIDANKLLIPTPIIAIVGGKEVKDNRTSLTPIQGIVESFKPTQMGGMGEKFREISWASGLEYSYNNQFFVRTGFRYEDQYKGNRNYLTFGAGFKMNVFNIDVAYLYSLVQSNPLDQTLRFTLSFDLNGLRGLADM